MDPFEDFNRTVRLLGELALYAHTPDVDAHFVATVAPALAASLPTDNEPPPGLFPPGYDPSDGPDYPEPWW